MDAGTTTHCRVTFDSLAVKNPALKLLPMCDEDYELVSGWFGGIELAVKPVKVLVSGYPPSPRSAPPLGVSVTPGRLPQPARLRYLFVCELSKRFMEAQDRGWLPPDGDKPGLSLARFLAAQALATRGEGAPEADLDPTPAWLNSERADYLNRTTAGAGEVAVGCRVLFLDYLHAGLGFAVEQIVAAPGPTLADVYRALTGGAEDPFPRFRDLVAVTTS